MSGILNQLSQLHPDAAATLVGILTVAWLIAILFGAVILRRYVLKKAEIELAHRRLEVEGDLKEMMLERGLSADEIEQVLAARLALPEDRKRLAKAV